MDCNYWICQGGGLCSKNLSRIFFHVQVNDLHAELFNRILNPEKLPPTEDVLFQHLKSSQDQLRILISAYIPKLSLPLPEEYGWSLDGDNLILIFH